MIYVDDADTARIHALGYSMDSEGGTLSLHFQAYERDNFEIIIEQNDTLLEHLMNALRAAYGSDLP